MATEAQTLVVNETTCIVEIGKYANGQPRLQLYDAEDYSPYMTASCAIPDALQLGEIAIKNYSENEGIWDILLDAGIIEDTGKRIRQGFVVIYIGRLL